MKDRYLFHAGCLLAAVLVFSGCTAGHQVGPVKQSKAPTAKNAAVTPDKKVVNKPSGHQAAVKPKGASKPVAKTIPKPTPAPTPKPAPAAAAAKPAIAPAVPAVPAKVNPLEHYSVKVTLDKSEVAVGKSVRVRVLVEAPDYPSSGNMAHGFKVNFSGIDFAKEAPEVECLRAHPSGSEVFYFVKAAKAGSFDAVANVSLFPTRKCSTACSDKIVKKRSTPVKISVR
ncbi:MAG: hypothetical protein P8Y65_08655 [Campylobacterales bacterium]|jgi:hypothetical protein